MYDEQWLSELLPFGKAAEYKKMNHETLRYYAKHGRGPKGHKIGGVAYFHPADLDSWHPEKLKTGPRPHEAD